MNMSEKKEILLILPVAPYPLRAQGISIRYLPIIKHLSDKCMLDVIIISKEPCDKASIEPLKKYCRKVSNITHPDSIRASMLKKFIVRCGFFLPWTLPRSWTIYGGDLIAEELDKRTAGVNYSTLVCVSGYLYPYIGSITAKKKIIDFIDSPSLLTRRNVIGSKRHILIRRFEAWKTYRWEAKIIKESTAVIYISSFDANAIPQNLAPNDKRYVIPNGFSANDYTDRLEESIKSPSIGFLGNMSYFPNIEAATWLHDEVYCRVKTKFYRLSMYIIGRSPDESVKRLEDGEGVYITGEVDLIWPYINALDILVFPLQRGAGLKNKILEAMYARRLVITTRIGNEGIEGVSSKDLLVCETADEFCKAITKYLELPEERRRIGEAGRRFVEERFSWGSILEDFERLVLC